MKRTQTVATDANPALTPKLRFPEFRNEPGWTKHKLAEKAAVLKGKGISKADLDADGTLPCIRYGELYTYYGETIRTVASRTKVPAAELFLSKSNDVIIPSSGETKIDIATASCVLLDDVALGGDLNVIRSALNGTFLSYYLNGPKRFDIAKIAQGDAVVHLYPHQLEKLEIAVPPSAEQQRIAECLSTLDELIGAESQKLDALEVHKKGLAQQLFPHDGETLPVLRFPEFQSAPDWTKHKLAEKADILKGKGISKADIDPSGLLPCIRYGELYTYYGETIEAVASRTRVPATELFLSRPNDVIIPSSGETKIDIATASCVLLGGVALGGDLNVIRSDLNGSFLSYYLNGAKKFDIAKVAQGDSVVHLYPHQLEQLEIAVPSPAEQQRIATCLSSLAELITAKSVKIKALKTHKKALMQQLFPSPEEIEA